MSLLELLAHSPHRPKALRLKLVGGQIVLFFLYLFNLAPVLLDMGGLLLGQLSQLVILSCLGYHLIGVEAGPVARPAQQTHLDAPVAEVRDDPPLLAGHPDEVVAAAGLGVHQHKHILDAVPVLGDHLAEPTVDGVELLDGVVLLGPLAQVGQVADDADPVLGAG